MLLKVKETILTLFSMKFYISLLLLFSLSVARLHAQDRIIKKDGREIPAIVKTVDAEKINYKRFDNQEGPEYSIARKLVLCIIYQNKTVDNLGNKSSEKKLASINQKAEKKKIEQVPTKHNLISLLPAVFTRNKSENFMDRGVGISFR